MLSLFALLTLKPSAGLVLAMAVMLPGSQPAPARRNVAELFGREQGPEPFTTQAFAALTSPILNRNVPVARPLIGINFIWRGRVVIGTANYTAVAAEAPQTIMERFRITGNHRLYNQQIPIDVSGATAFAWPRLFQFRGNTMLIGTTLQAELSSPLAQAGATFGNTGTYDLEIHYWIPVSPFLAHTVKRRAIPYYWYPEDWADTLQAQVFFGDSTSFGTPGGSTTVTFTAFGSGAGSPTLYAYPEYALLGGLARSVQTALVVRNEIRNVTGVVSAIVNGSTLQTLAKQKTLNLLVKSGINLTGVSAGVQVFASLSDTLLDRTQIIADNKAIRNNPANFSVKAASGRKFATVHPQGYLLQSFIDGAMDPLTMFKGNEVSAGGQFNLVSDVATANANNQVAIVQEQVFGDARAALQ